MTFIEKCNIIKMEAMHFEASFEGVNLGGLL